MYVLLLYLLQPFRIAFVFTALGLAWAVFKRTKTKRTLVPAAVGLATLYLACSPVVAYLTLGRLQSKFPRRYARPESIDTIVVMGGYVTSAKSQSVAQLGVDSLYRCLHAARLYKNGPPCRIVVSGGKIDRSVPGPTVGQAMADQLVELGVDAQDIVIENRSQSTYENAVESARILKDLGINKVVLVSDAPHLLRSSLCFSAQGIASECHGVRYRATRLTWSLSTFLPSLSAANHINDAWHESLGIVWYWLHDRI